MSSHTDSIRILEVQQTKSANIRQQRGGENVLSLYVHSKKKEYHAEWKSLGLYIISKIEIENYDV